MHLGAALKDSQGGRALHGLAFMRDQANSEYPVFTFRSEAMRAKFRCLEGNNPDPHLRFLSFY